MVSGFVRAEMQGFEPWRRLTGLAHFECAPFGLLGTSPYFKTLEDGSLEPSSNAGSRGRTDTTITGHRILSPERLPIPPYRQHQIIIQKNLHLVNNRLKSGN